MTYYFAKTTDVPFDAAVDNVVARNVIVRKNGDGKIEVAAVDPVSSMQAVQNPALASVASVVRQKLKIVVESFDAAEELQ